MSCIVIGDIHGRNLWKAIVKKHLKDQVVFVGDYFDSKEGIAPEDQIRNFNEILLFKLENPDRVTLLSGNHDFHYFPKAKEQYGGYSVLFAKNIQNALRPALKTLLLEACAPFGKFLISHAGLTRTWCRNNKIPLQKPVEAVNRLFYKNRDAFRFSPGPLNDPSGNEVEQGPLWVRPESLEKDGLRDFIQIVGHTQFTAIKTGTRAIFADCLAYTPAYLILQKDGGFTIERV